MKKITSHAVLFVSLFIYASFAQAESISTVTDFKSIQRNSTQDVYYDKIKEQGRLIDKALRGTKAAEPIIAASSFVTAFLVSQELDKNGKPVEVLILGFSAGHVMKVVFSDKEWNDLVSAQLIEENVPAEWQTEVTALAYDPIAKRIYIGHGHKLIRDWTHGLDIGKKFDIKKPGTWFAIDFDNLYSEEHTTYGGGIRIYDLYDSDNDGKPNGFVKDPGGDLLNTKSKTAVLSLYPFTSKTGENHLFAFWGPDRVPQTYTFGVSFVPMPKPVPIPVFSGGDNPNPENYNVRYIDTRLAFDKEQNRFWNVTYLTTKLIKNDQRQQLNPTAATFGKNTYNVLIYGYSDGSVWAYNIVGEGSGTGSWEAVKGNGSSPVKKLLYSTIGDEEYLLIAYENHTSELVQYNTVKQSGAGIPFSRHTISSPHNLHTEGWGSNINRMIASEDGKFALAVLDNNSAIEWFSFERKGFTAEIAGAVSGTPAVTALTSPVESKTKGVYRFYVAYANGVIREGEYNTVNASPVYFKDITTHFNVPIDMHFGHGHQPNQIMRDRIGIQIDCGFSPITWYGIVGEDWMGIGEGTGLGCLNFGNMIYYHYDQLDYDADTETLYAYTLAIEGMIANPSWTATNGKDRLTKGRVGMGIDVFNAQSREWSIMQKPKFNFVDPAQASAHDYMDMTLLYPYSQLPQDKKSP